MSQVQTSAAPKRKTRRSRQNRDTGSTTTGTVNTTALRSPGILSGLGLYGLDKAEPALLAALVTEDPLLLIGPHGTGKSMLLERIADALGLCFRHYNASLISFDDLIGFPVPDSASTGLKYLQTPANIWDAEAVFFDEVSRCKPDVQNKLFSIIHERKVQGLRLEKLRYRWSAMNPPAGASGSENYSGSEPLDSALADRYAWVIQIPDWNSLGEEAQERILCHAGKAPEEGAAEQLRSLVEETRLRWKTVREQIQPLLVDYVRQIAVLLQEADIRLSTRRLVMLMSNISALHAVQVACGADSSEMGESFRQTLYCSIPQIAEGMHLPRGKLSAAHAEAWKRVLNGKAMNMTRILSERDPVIRVVLAARGTGLDLQERSLVVADCMQSLPDGARHAVAAWLVENDLAGRLVAAVAEQVAEDYAMVAIPSQGRYSTLGWIEGSVGNAILAKIRGLDGRDAGSQALAQLLTTMFARSLLKSDTQVERISESWNQTREVLARLDKSSE